MARDQLVSHVSFAVVVHSDVITTDKNIDTSLLGAKWIVELCIVRSNGGLMKQECAEF